MAQTTIYIIDSTDASKSFAIQPRTFDGAGGVQQNTDLTLYGNAAPNWGERFNENFYRLLENFAIEQREPGDADYIVGEIWPKSDETLGSGHGINNPVIGQMWFNKTDEKIYTYNGTEWILSSGGISVGAAAPTGLSIGNLWYDTSVPQLKVWTGTEWISVADRYVLKSDATFMPFSSTIPSSRAGELNFLPLEIGGDFTGAAIPFRGGSTSFMVRERDGSLIGLRPGHNGIIQRLFFMYALDGVFDNVIATDAEYRPPFLASDEVVERVINGHSFSEGFHAVVLNTTTFVRKAYWIDVNGTMDPVAHTGTDLTGKFGVDVTNSLVGVERLYDENLWVVIDFRDPATGIDVYVYDNAFTLLNSTTGFSTNTDLTILQLSGQSHTSISYHNTTQANVQHYISGNIARIQLVFGMFIFFNTVPDSRSTAFNMLVDYDIVGNSFTRPYPAPYTFDPNTVAQIYPLNTLAAYQRQVGYQQLEPQEHFSTTVYPSRPELFAIGTIADGTTWEDLVDNWGKPGFTTRNEVNITPIDASLIGKRIVRLTFIGDVTLLVEATSRQSGEPASTTKQVIAVLPDTTTTRTLPPSSSTALETPINVFEATDPALSDIRQISTIIRDTGELEARYFDEVAGEISSFDGDTFPISLSSEITLPSDYLTQIESIVDSVEPASAAATDRIIEIQYLVNNIFSCTYAYYDSSAGTTTVSIITLTLAASPQMFSLVDSDLAFDVQNSSDGTLRGKRGSYGVFHDSSNDAVYAIVPFPIIDVVGNSRSRTILIKVSTLTPGQLDARTGSLSNLAIPYDARAGIHPTFGPYFANIFNFSSARTNLTYREDPAVSVVDRMRNSFDEWIAGDPTSIITALTIQSPAGFNVFVSEFPLFINGSEFSIPTQSIDLAALFASPQNKTFYMYVEIVSGVAEIIFSETDIPDSNTLMQIGIVTTGPDGILTVDVGKTTRVNNFHITLNPTPFAIPVADSSGSLNSWVSDDSVFKNQLINGDMRIWQRGTSFSHSTEEYTADRWNVGLSPSPVTVTRSTDAPAGGTYSMRIQKAGGDDALLRQGIELPITGAAGPFQIGSVWTFSFYVKADVTSAFSVLVRFRDSITSGAESEVTPVTTTSSNAGVWTRVDAVVNIDASPNVSNRALVFLIQLPTSSTDVYITNVQLERGLNATEFEYRTTQTETTLCQRYYEKSYNIAVNPGTATQTGAKHTNDYSVRPTLHCYCDFMTRKRTTPTVIIYNPNTGAAGSVYQIHGSPGGSHAVDNVGASETSVTIINMVSPLAPTDPNNLFQIHFTADAEF